MMSMDQSHNELFYYIQDEKKHYPVRGAMHILASYLVYWITWLGTKSCFRAQNQNFAVKDVEVDK
jgi:hypothetical protein